MPTIPERQSCSFVDVTIPVRKQVKRDANWYGEAIFASDVIYDPGQVGGATFAYDDVIYGGIREAWEAGFRHGPPAPWDGLPELPSWLPGSMNFSFVCHDWGSHYDHPDVGVYYSGINSEFNRRVDDPAEVPADFGDLWDIDGTIRFTTHRTVGGYGVARAYWNDELVEEYVTPTVVDTEDLVSKFAVRCPYAHFDPGLIRPSPVGLGGGRDTIGVGDITATVWETEKGTADAYGRYSAEKVIVASGVVKPHSVKRLWYDYWHNEVLAKETVSQSGEATTATHQLEYSRANDLYGQVAGLWMTADLYGNNQEASYRYKTFGTGEPWHVHGRQQGFRYSEAEKWLLYISGLSYIPADGGRFVHAVADATYRTKLVYVTGGILYFRRVEQPEYAATYSSPVQVTTEGAAINPCVAAYDDGRLAVWYMQDDAQAAKYSTDDGQTWTAYGATMLGNDLKNIYVRQHHGISVAVGVRDSGLYFVRSNDSGATQDTIPPSTAVEKYIGACAEDAVPCLEWYPDGRIVVWAQDDDGEVISFVDSAAGYGTWVAIA